MPKEFGIGSTVTVQGRVGVVIGESDDWLNIQENLDGDGVHQFTVNKNNTTILTGEQPALVLSPEDAELAAAAAAAGGAGDVEPSTILDELPNFDDDDANASSTEDAQASDVDDDEVTAAVAETGEDAAEAADEAAAEPIAAE